MNKTYSGEITLTIQAANIECDGSIEDFVISVLLSVLPDGWMGEIIDVTGDIMEDK
ncbi:hypothetical protein [Massilicoli timonensis]|uniref:hypothetical protein n=1 Tax=Massilicoli timonensis TaxID=2015901 RepID=UPI00248A9736|nr:hypothetical protein [Massilicoli timonensis]